MTIQGAALERVTDEYFIKTASGAEVPLLHPEPGHIQIRDIATALARTCWAAGAPGAGFYSAAQHAVEVRHQLPDNLDALYGLLHNARVAYLGKVPAPLMVTVGGSLFGAGEIERRFDAAIMGAVGLRTSPGPESAERLRRAVAVIEATEARDIMGGLSTQAGGVSPRAQRLVPLTRKQPATGFWDKAEETYLREFWGLILHLDLPIRPDMSR